MLSLVTLTAFVFGVTSASVLSLDPPKSRIINGNTVTDTSAHPHQLTLLSNGYHICGAALLDRDYAVTAAHCVETTQTYAVAGKFLDFSSPGNYFYITVEQVIKHPNYGQGSGGFPNDIALLRLNRAQTTDEMVAAHSIRVAYPGESSFAGQSCMISGWGNTETGSTNVLKEAEVVVLTTTQCKTAWSPSSSSIVDSHICVWGASGDRSGACNGDSGGPLTCRDAQGAPVLAGVTSWGRSGCHTNGVVEYPSVYTRLESHYNWLKSVCNCV